MPVTRLRPNATWFSTGVARTGGTSVFNALADQDDASYVRRSAGTSGNSMVCVEIETLAIPAGQRVVSVVPGMRYKLAATDGKPCAVRLSQVKDRNAKTYYNAANVPYGKALAIVDAIGRAESGSPFAPDGAAWAQADLDDLLLHAADSHTATYANRAYVYELFADVYTMAPATVAVTAPSGTITATSFPAIALSISTIVEAWQVDVPGIGVWLTAGDVQVRVFSAAVYGAPGFDPETAAAVWEGLSRYENAEYVGGVTPGVVTVDLTTGVPLPNGTTYRAYARVTRDVPSGGADFWSAWAYAEFTLNLDVCAPPSVVSVTAASDHHWAVATFSVASRAGHTAPVLQVQASYDEGVSWHDVLAYGTQPIAFDTAVPVSDSEVRGGHAAWYRARVETTFGGQRVASDWSAVGTVSVPAFRHWSLRVYQGAAYVMPDSGPVRVLGELDEERTEDVGVFYPKDRSYPVVVGGRIRGRNGTLRIAASVLEVAAGQIGATELELVDYLAHAQTPLLLESPFGDYKWIRIMSRPYSRSGAATAERRVYSLGYLEVARPEA